MTKWIGSGEDREPVWVKEDEHWFSVFLKFLGGMVLFMILIRVLGISW